MNLKNLKSQLKFEYEIYFIKLHNKNTKSKT